MAGDRSRRRANKLAPTELAAVACPVERARMVCKVARRKGTLPAGLAEVRRQAIVEALDKTGPDPFTVLELAEELDLTAVRIYQIVRQQAPTAPTASVGSSDVSRFASKHPDDDTPAADSGPRLSGSSMGA